MIRNPQRINHLLLLVFPATFLLLQLLIRHDYRFFFLSAHDPAYAYLFNGLNLAQGNMQLGLAVHPGTTLHVFTAVNIWFLNLFTHGYELPAPVLQNPEFFLGIMSYEIVLINTLTLMILGLGSFSMTRNLPLSLALQLTPFISVQAFSYNSMVMLEPLLLCIELFIMLLLTKYTFGQQKSLYGKDLVFMAILMALGMATKIIFFPLLFLPFFIIEGARNKLKYAGITVVSLAVFLIPIYGVFTSFYNWLAGLVMHTGVYGSGEPDIVDFQVFKMNFGRIFTANYLFTGCFALLVSTLIATIIPGFSERVNRAKLKMIMGLVLVFLLNILMVAKHFSNHYLIISYNLTLFGLILAFSVIMDLLPVRKKNLQVYAFRIMLTFLAGTILLFYLVRGIHFSPCFRNPRLQGLDFVQGTVKNTQRIIVLENSGPFIETALFHGFAFSGGMGAGYARMLKNEFPNTYFYNPKQDALFDWIKEINLDNLLSKSHRTYLYYSSGKDTFPPVLASRINALMKRDLIANVRSAHTMPESKEYIYEIMADTSGIEARKGWHETVFCSYDELTTDGNSFLSSDSSLRFDKVHLQSPEVSFSGKFSVKLGKDRPYGPLASFPARRGYYEIKVQRLSSDDTGFIVASDNAGGGFYRANAIASGEKDGRGWDTVELTVDIPEHMEGKEINVSLWYPGKRTCFFDDFSICFIEIP